MKEKSSILQVVLKYQPRLKEIGLVPNRGAYFDFLDSAREEDLEKYHPSELEQVMDSNRAWNYYDLTREFTRIANLCPTPQLPGCTGDLYLPDQSPGELPDPDESLDAGLCGNDRPAWEREAEEQLEC